MSMCVARPTDRITRWNGIIGRAKNIPDSHRST
jgi:hypothetical protein